MTRELKLALIVGFSLVLVVMVLVSDHLSKARKVELAPPATEAALTTKLPQVDPLNATNGTPSTTSATDPLATNTGTVDPLAGNANDPVTIQEQKDKMKLVADRLMANGETAAKTGGMVVPNTTDLTPPEPRADIVSGDVRPMGMEPAGPTTIIQGNRTNINTTNRLGEIVNADKPAVNEKIHVIESGQSLYAVAKQYYGNGKYWKQLLEYNKATVKSETALKVGMKIKVPDLAVLTGNPADATVVKNDALKTDPLKLDPAKKDPLAKVLPKTTKGKTYTVQKGDTPGTIAKKALGSSKRAHEIMDLNKIKDDGGLKIGMVLQLPNE